MYIGQIFCIKVLNTSFFTQYYFTKFNIRYKIKIGLAIVRYVYAFEIYDVLFIGHIMLHTYGQVWVTKITRQTVYLFI